MYKYLIGKSNNGKTWLPLWIHLKDTAGIMELLIKNWLSGNTKRFLGESEEALVKLAKFVGYTHDIGKATVLFQGKISEALPDARTRLEEKAKLTYREADQYCTPHALASEAILLYLGCPGGIASVAGAHHGKPQGVDADENMGAYPKNYFPNGGKSLWQDAWMELFQQALSESGYKNSKELPLLTQPIEVILTGLVIMADWIASNTEYFPLISTDEYGDMSMYPERVLNGWDKVKLTHPWNGNLKILVETGFKARFGFVPNDIQKAVLDAVNTMSQPGLMILEAPMGIGKTEAALAFSEACSARFNAGGIFFGLPTQATANGIFPRLLSWADSQSDDGLGHSIRLAHGMAELNEDYLKLQEHAPTVDSDADDEKILVNQWFCGNKKVLLADFVTGTVDQLLMASLKQKHVMLRHLGLAGKVVIIDEVHAYDTYMDQYLDRSLTWLGWYGVPTILLSATLTTDRRKELIKAYQPKATPGDWEKNVSYPLLTWTEGEEIKQDAPELNTDVTEVIINKITEDSIAHTLKDKLKDGGCAGVIVNTVSKAQVIADQLKLEMPDKEVKLFHSQFLMPDRAEIEKILTQRVGKKSTAKSRNNLIVVGTQVMEQSLDVDFDMLMTELCPMDLMMQRIGRLHRHKRKRPASMENATCYVIDTRTDAFDKGSSYVYDKWLLYRTRNLLPEKITLPQDISKLVQETYRWDSTSTIDEKEAELHLKYEDVREKKREKASAYVIQPPKIHKLIPKLNTLDGWMQDDLAKGDDASRAAVRDGDMPTEVLVLMQKKDGSIHFLPWQENGMEVDGNTIPNSEIALKISRQSLRLPGAFSRTWNVGKVISDLEEINTKYFSAWQKSPMLRGELILLLNDEFTAHIGGMVLQYNKDTGLRYQKENNDE